MRPYLGKTLHKNMAGGVARGEGPEFKPQYCSKNNNNNNNVLLILVKSSLCPYLIIYIFSSSGGNFCSNGFIFIII
jgi:hypothetical protein